DEPSSVRGHCRRAGGRKEVSAVARGRIPGEDRAGITGAGRPRHQAAAGEAEHPALGDAPDDDRRGGETAEVEDPREAAEVRTRLDREVGPLGVEQQARAPYGAASGRKRATEWRSNESRLRGSCGRDREAPRAEVRARRSIDEMDEDGTIAAPRGRGAG